MAKRATPPLAPSGTGRTPKTPEKPLNPADAAKAKKAALAAKQPDPFSWKPGKSTAERALIGGPVPSPPTGKLVKVADTNAEKPKAPRKRAKKKRPDSEE